MELEAGILLIAQPFINDGTFKRSVILLAEHNDYGSLGFVLNRPLHLKLKDVLPDMKEIHFPVYYGGPVASNQLFFVHERPDLIRNGLPIYDGHFWSGDFDDLKDALNSKKIQENEVRFFIGYSGWEPMQLNTEINEKAWLLSKATLHSLFRLAPEDVWGTELKRLGSNYAILANFPDDPSLN